MHRRSTSLLSLLVLALLAASSVALAGGKAKPEECVPLAHSWDEAVAEARMLNVPIVVHSHGFFCGPCWGMHSGVMKNKDYIEYAEAHTVEVIALSRLQEGIEQKDKRSETYEEKANGQVRNCLVEFPGLTVEEMVALASSKASSYNNTGGIPYTCIVNPHSLEEMANFPGGGHSAGKLIEELDKQAKAIEKEHGKGMSRKDFRKFLESEGKALAEAADGEFAKALSILDGALKKSADWPEALQARGREAREKVVAQAGEALQKVAEMADTDAKEATKQLGRLRAKLKGAGLDERIEAIAARLKPAD